MPFSIVDLASQIKIVVLSEISLFVLSLIEFVFVIGIVFYFVRFLFYILRIYGYSQYWFYILSLFFVIIVLSVSMLLFQTPYSSLFPNS